MDILTNLHYLGLSDDESKVFLELLRRGESNPATLSEATGVKRSTVYVMLENLRSRGFVNLVPQEKKRRYTAVDPERIIENLRTQLGFAERLVPILLEQSEEKKQAFKTIFFRGEKELKRAIWYRVEDIAHRETVAFWASGEEVSNDLRSELFKWRDYVHQQGTKIRAFAPHHETLADFRELDKKHNVEVRLLPYVQYSARVSVEVADAFVKIFMFASKQCIVIESRDVVLLLRQIFDMLWMHTAHITEKK